MSPTIHIKDYSSKRPRPKFKPTHTYRTELINPSIRIRTLRVSENNLRHWNLLALVDSSYPAPRSDRSSGMPDDPPAVHVVEGTSLVLDFDAESELERFLTCCKILSNERQKQIDAFEHGRKLAIVQADMP